MLAKEILIADKIYLVLLLHFLMKISIVIHQTIKTISSYILEILILKKIFFPFVIMLNIRCVYIESLPGKHIFSHHRCEHETAITINR